MIAGLSFLLGFEKIEDDDSDDSGSEDEAAQEPHVVVNKEALYKVGLSYYSEFFFCIPIITYDRRNLLTVIPKSDLWLNITFLST